MDKKIQELIAVGASVTANCVPCFKFHFAKARKEGATDDEIKAGLGYHFGLGGGYHGDKVCNQHVGGKNPRITLYNGFDDDLNYVDEIHLHGKQLINHVRAIYNIPQPGQPKLF